MLDLDLDADLIQNMDFNEALAIKASTHKPRGDLRISMHCATPPMSWCVCSPPTFEYSARYFLFVGDRTMIASFPQRNLLR